MSGVFDPCICLSAQGAKRVIWEGEEYTYDANHYLITYMGLPIVANVVDASKEFPLPGVVLKVDIRTVSQLIVDSNLPAPRQQQAGRCITMSEVSIRFWKPFCVW